MATRSFIARQTTDGFEGAYCHWDGYPAYNGVILRDHYSDPEKLAELLSHGDMSTLGPSVGQAHAFDDRDPAITTYYGRDRVETGPHTEPSRSSSLQEMLDRAGSRGCEFFYLFAEGQWQYAERGPQFFGGSDGSSFSELRPLTIR